MTTRRTLAALAVVVVALASVVVAALHLMRRDRAALFREFDKERSEVLDAAVREILGDSRPVLDHMRFASELIQTADSSADHERTLKALLAVNRQYRLGQIFDGAGPRVLSVLDPLAGREFRADVFDQPMRDAAAQALSARPGHIEISPPIREAGGGWLRAFATSFAHARNGAPTGAGLACRPP